jgi:hypothetical protein
LLDRLPESWQAALYRVALERGYEEMLLTRLVVAPFRRLVERIAAAEQAWTDWLGDLRLRGPRDRERKS